MLNLINVLRQLFALRIRKILHIVNFFGNLITIQQIINLRHRLFGLTQLGMNHYRISTKESTQILMSSLAL